MPLKNNQIPKDFLTLITDPTNSASALEMVVICSDRLLKCELALTFEVNPEVPTRVRPAYELVYSEVRIPGQHRFTAAEYLTNKTFVVTTADGRLFHYHSGKNELLKTFESADQVSIIGFIPTALYLICIKSNK
jgi:hypothetical protein